ncbi:MAG TPA: hypothetical protein VJ867_08670 [Gemmatimonadaceae bacterium]|nr:hypothetical protein [Gemmatimonadaceae bacterium]
MRALVIGAIAAATLPAATANLSAQQTPSAPTATVAPGVVDGRLRTEIFIIRTLFGGIHAPPADSFRVGTQDVAAGSTFSGTYAVARGNLAIRGRVTGNAITLHGDVIVYPGGSVGGSATAVDGRVRTAGGVVEGDVRSIRGITGTLLARTAGSGAPAEPPSAWDAMKQVLGWFAVLVAIGIGVLLFAERNLDGVVDVLDSQFSRSFWTGVLTQIAALPALMLILLALAISLIGILLIPFAAVAYIIALAGLLTLGFLAIARFTGRAFFRASPASRAVHLRSLFVGLVLYLGLWFLAAAFIWTPVAGSILRAIALAVSWVGVTFGLGATVLSRAGTRRSGGHIAKPRAVDDFAWQTPTPVTGVVAARRPVVTAKEN